MTDFVDLFPDEDIMEALGDSIDYMPVGGGNVPIKARVDHDVSSVGLDGYTQERRTEIEFLLSLLPSAPQRGDRVKHRAAIYTLKAQLTNDGVYSRWAVI